jgi:hypothetical protein
LREPDGKGFERLIISRLNPFFIDGFVKNPISALRFIPLSLRRTAPTPHSTGFARLELGLFAKPSVMMTFYEFVFTGYSGKRLPGIFKGACGRRSSADGYDVHSGDGDRRVSSDATARATAGRR